MRAKPALSPWNRREGFFRAGRNPLVSGVSSSYGQKHVCCNESLQASPNSRTTGALRFPGFRKSSAMPLLASNNIHRYMPPRLALHHSCHQLCQIRLINMVLIVVLIVCRGFVTSSPCGTCNRLCTRGVRPQTALTGSGTGRGRPPHRRWRISLLHRHRLRLAALHYLLVLRRLLGILLRRHQRRLPCQVPLGEKQVVCHHKVCRRR